MEMISIGWGSGAEDFESEEAILHWSFDDTGSQWSSLSSGPTLQKRISKEVTQHLHVRQYVV